MAYSGYKIITYIDVNPNSPTFDTTRTERVLDTEECSNAQPNWLALTEYCETDASGRVTGYYIYVERDAEPLSPTYGDTRQRKVTAQAGQCQDADDSPSWVIYDGYCETKQYEPSMVIGQTGIYIAKLVDENQLSPTFQQRIESGLTEVEWQTISQDPFPCETPNTEPDIEAISQYCETSGGGNTGFLIVSGLDKNPYSPTYLTVTTAKTYDVQTCPLSDDCHKYEFIDFYHSISDGSSGGGAVASSVASAGTLTYNPSNSSSWIHYVSTQSGGSPVQQYIYICEMEENDGSTSRVGHAVFDSDSGNCSFSATVYQGTGQTTPIVYDEWTFVFDTSSIGGLIINYLGFIMTNGSKDYRSSYALGIGVGGSKSGLRVPQGYSFVEPWGLDTNIGDDNPAHIRIVSTDFTEKILHFGYYSS